MAFFSMLLGWIDFKSVLILLTLILLTIWYARRPRNLPPGPYGLPILGYIPQMAYALYKGEKIHEVLANLTKIHGKVFSLNIFGTPVIILNDVGLIREAFQIPALCDKGFNNALHVRLVGRALMQCSTFTQYRKFASSTLRHFGVGSSKFEDHVTEKLEELVKELKGRHNGHSVNPGELLYFANANIMCPVLFGKCFDYEDEKARELLSINSAAMQLLGQSGYEIFMPFTFPTKANRTLWSASGLLFDFINGTKKEHQKVLDSDNLADYTDIYLNEVANKTPDSNNSYLHQDNVSGQLFFLFLAGANPVAAWVHWALIYLAGYPEVQSRLQKELDAEIGRDRLPRMADQKALPYLKAFMHELERIVTLVTLGHMHSASSDVQFHGYTIPKGSVIIPNLWWVHHDPDVWKNPDEFKPERFLNDSGEFVVRGNYIPYGAGRRICLGESLARTENYLFLTHLVHHFTFKKPREQPTLNYKGTAGFICIPTPQKIEFIQRE